MLNIKYIRCTPFDVTTHQGMEDERYRLANLAAIANIISRIFSAGSMILAIRLSAPYLGEERFGIWMTIVSFITMLTFLDMGAGNALTNKVAHAAVKKNPQHLKKHHQRWIRCIVYHSLWRLPYINDTGYDRPLGNIIQK